MTMCAAGSSSICGSLRYSAISSSNGPCSAPAGGAVVGEDYIVCRRVDRTAFLRNVQRIAECIVHFFLIEELVAEDDQLVIVD